MRRALNADDARPLCQETVRVRFVAVVGATGAVGTIIRELLEDRKFPFTKIKFLASRPFGGQDAHVRRARRTRSRSLTPEAFDGVDLAIASTPDDVARDFVPEAVRRGCVVVDESGYWRMDPKVPLVIPEVNPEAVDNHQGIIASPNCSTTQMVVAMKPLHDAGRDPPRGRQHLPGHQRRGPGRQPRPGTAAPGRCWPARTTSYEMLRPSDRLQLHPADRLAQAPGLHLRRNEDGLRDAQDPGRRRRSRSARRASACR